jgi:hypothetical protein
MTNHTECHDEYELPAQDNPRFHLDAWLIGQIQTTA